MKVREFEGKCWTTDHIRVVIRAPVETVIGNFTRSNAAIGTRTVSWYWTQLAPLIGAHESTIIDGSGVVPHGGRHLDTVRKSYS